MRKRPIGIVAIDVGSATISLLDGGIEKCGVAGCPIARATHFVAWKTKAGASGSYRCPVHAQEFAKRRGLVYPQPIHALARAAGWEPWRPWPTTGICACGEQPTWSKNGQLRCHVCLSKEVAP